MNTYNKLENIKNKLRSYSAELAAYQSNGAQDISIIKVQVKITELYKEVE